MADFIVAKANTGEGLEQLAVDDIAGVLFPRTKITIGDDGVNGGDVSAANPLPVVMTGAATEATLAALAATVKAEDAVHASGDAGVFVLAVRQDSDIAMAANGDYSPLQINEVGRLKTAGAPAQFAAVTGSIVAVAGVVVADVTQVSNVMAHCTGTFSAINCTFEGSIDGGVTYFGVQAVRTNANTIELTTGSLSAAPIYAWELSVNALTHFRVRCTARTSGTQNWTFTLGSYATEPIPAAQVTATQPVSGTVTVLPVTPTTTFTNSAATTNAAAIKASAGTVWSVIASNTNAAARYLKLYNLAVAPTVGTSVPVLTVVIPPGAVVSIGGGSNGIRFATGIAIAITAAAADSDTTAVAASEIKVATSFT